MRGHTRRRGDGWSFVADAGHQPAARCTTCGRRAWITRGPGLTTCPHATCDGLGGQALERRQVWKSGFKTKGAAEAALRIFLTGVEAGADPFPEKMTVTQWADRWATSERVEALRPRTRARYLGIVRDDIKPVIGSMELTAVRPRHVGFILEQARGRGLSARSVTQVRAVASSMLRAAVDAELIDTNPVSAVRAPKVERPKLLTPTTADLTALIHQARDTTWELPLLLAATTGMRRSEVLAVSWAHVDLEAGRLTVAAGLQRSRLPGGGSQLELLDVKTERSHRTVALPAMTVERLRRWRKEQLERRVAIGPAWVDRDLVCDRGDGDFLDPDAFSNGFKRLAKAAGLPDGTRLHDVRHGVATALLKGGVHPAIASAVLGHARVAFTLDVYSHVDVGMTATAANELNRALGG